MSYGDEAGAMRAARLGEDAGRPGTDDAAVPSRMPTMMQGAHMIDERLSQVQRRLTAQATRLGIPPNGNKEISNGNKATPTVDAPYPGAMRSIMNRLDHIEYLTASITEAV